MTASYRDVDVSEAARMVQQGAHMLDVREAHEWAAGRAPQAHHLPLGDLPAEHGRLPTDTPIVAVCRSGARSGQAAAALAQAGYDVVNMAGGMRAWRDSGREVTTDDGSPGTVD